MVKDYKYGDKVEIWYFLSEVEIKEIDEQGRIVIPKRWRNKHLKGKKVVLKLKQDALEIIPYDTLNLTEYFGTIKADVKSDLADWHSLRRELRKL